MARTRMYAFERAYVDYGGNLSSFRSKSTQARRGIWHWFWDGTGAYLMEMLLRIAIVAVALTACVLFVRYEQDRGVGFTGNTVLGLIAIALFTIFILWGWKYLIHLLARLSTGIVAICLLFVVIILAIVLATVIFIPYLLVLFVITALSFFLFVPLRLAHGIWMIKRKITYRCPYDDCAYNGLPIHICSCGEHYDDLRPSFYGIFYHTCKKGGHVERLPTMDLWGRNKLDRLCGSCKRPLVFSSLGELPERPISIVGGPNTGKTIYLRQAIRSLQKTVGSQRGGSVKIDAPEQIRAHESDLALLDRGQVLPKTAGDVMHALGVAVRFPGKRSQNSLLYFYDAPGEHFLTVERFGQKQIIRHISGVLLLVDPFTLPQLKTYGQQMDIGLQPSETSFQRITDVLVVEVNQVLDRPTDMWDVPLAVVITKADALPADQYEVLKNLLPVDGQTIDSAYSDLCRRALVTLGAEQEVHALELKFNNVRYFACSALGRMPGTRNGNPFEPKGVIQPLLWLLDVESV